MKHFSKKVKFLGGHSNQEIWKDFTILENHCHGFQTRHLETMKFATISYFCSAFQSINLERLAIYSKALSWIPCKTFYPHFQSRKIWKDLAILENHFHVFHLKTMKFPIMCFFAGHSSQ